MPASPPGDGSRDDRSRRRAARGARDVGAWDSGARERGQPGGYAAERSGNAELGYGRDIGYRPDELRHHGDEPRRERPGRRGDDDGAGRPGDWRPRARPDEGERAPYDPGGRAPFETGGRAPLDTGERARLDTGERARLDTGERARLDTGEPARFDAGAQGNDAGASHEQPVAQVRRLLSFAIAGLAGLLTGALVLGALITHESYAVVIFGVQALFVLAWTVASRPPAPWVVAGVGLAAAAVGDVAAVLISPASLAPLAYVTAGAFLAGVVGQLARPSGRVRVTESLGTTLAVVVGVIALATLIVLSRHARGTQSIVACLSAAGVAVTVARLADIVVPYPRIAPQVPRGGVGVVLGAMVGTAVAAVAGSLVDGLQTSTAAAAGLITALVAVVVDLSVGYADASRRLAGDPPTLWLARHMQGPLGAFALAAPAAYAASALLLVTSL